VDVTVDEVRVAHTKKKRKMVNNVTMDVEKTVLVPIANG
jgi:hypothetical protein